MSPSKNTDGMRRLSSSGALQDSVPLAGRSAVYRANKTINDMSGVCENERTNHAAKVLQDQLKKKVMFADAQVYQQHYEKVEPLCGFFRVLAKKCISSDPKGGDCDDAHKRFLLKVWIPDTVVFEKSGDPTWYYSRDDGLFLRTRNFTLEQLQARFRQDYSENAVIAVIKRKHEFNNFTETLTADRLADSLLSIKSLDTTTILQRFVMPRGSRASIIRCVWHRETPMRMYSIINRGIDLNAEMERTDSNDDIKYMATFQRAEYLDVFLVRPRAHAPIIKIMRGMLQWLAVHGGLGFLEFVCDFIRDESERYWLLQVKAFQLNTPVARPLSASLSRKDPVAAQPKKCGLCECEYQTQDLPYEQTNISIAEVHECCRRIAMPLSWSFSQTVVRKDSTTYGAFRLCRLCFELVTKLRSLFEVQKAFAWHFQATRDTYRSSRSQKSLMRKRRSGPSEMIRSSSTFPHFHSNVKEMKMKEDEEERPAFEPMAYLPQNEPVTVVCTQIFQRESARCASLRRPMLGYRLIFYLDEVHCVTGIEGERELYCFWDIFGVGHACGGQAMVEDLSGNLNGATRPFAEGSLVTRRRDVGTKKMSLLPLCMFTPKCLSVGYFFAESTRAVEQWSRNLEVAVKLFSGKNFLGVAKVDLRRVLSLPIVYLPRKVKIPFKHNALTVATLSLGVGLSDGMIYDTANMTLSELAPGIWTPPPIYSSPVPLSPSWLEMLGCRPTVSS